MATIGELEAQLLAGLAKKPDVKAIKALLLDPPYRSDTAQPGLASALGILVIGSQRAELAWLEKLAATTQQAWPDTWMRAWLLQSIASTSALIGRLLDGPSKPVVGAVPTAAHPAWLARAATHDFALLESLLADFLDGPATQIAVRAQVLLGWPKDARIAHAALAAHQGRLVGNALHPIWNALAGLIAVHGDSALRKKLSGLLAEDPTLTSAYWVSATRGGPDPAPRRKEAAATGAPKTPADWEAWVLSAPDDAGRRALWADWLLEQDDPRGELLSLQLADRALTPKEHKRIEALVRKHGRSWVGKLSAVADPKRLKFDRGVLVGIRVLDVPDGRVASDDLHWATIEELEVPSYRLAPKLEAKLLECAPRLRVLDEPSIGLLRRVLAMGAPKLERLSCDLGFHAEKIAPADVALMKAARLPMLRSLRVAGQPGPQVVKQLVAMPWFGALEHLCVDGGELAQRLDAVHGSKLPRLDVLAAQTQGWEPATGFSYRATRAGPKWRLEVLGLPEVPRTAPVDYFYESELMPTLTRLPTRRLSEVTLVVPSVFQASPKMARKVAAQIKRVVS